MAGKKLLVYLVLLLFCSIAHAACTDSDNGPVDSSKPTRFIGIKGAVDYGTGPKYDYCVSRLGGSGLQESDWVREYYCEFGQIASEDYRCADYDYAYCLAGVCVNYTGTQAALDDIGTPPAQESFVNCGNNKLDGKEQCDPPGKICMAYGGGVGTCSSKCMCEKTGQQNQTSQNYTANMTIDLSDKNKTNKSNATQQANGDAAANIAFETKQQNEPEIVVVQNESMSTPTGALPTDIQQIIDENNAEASEFMQKPGIRLTSLISKFVMKILSYFAGLLGG